MAAFKFKNLTDEIRNKMIAEVDLDVEREKLYLSKRLTEEGRIYYPVFLRAAFREGDEKNAERLSYLQ
ncbi:MAG: hypothetical protein LUD15_04795 [Bacteroides sp.]|nr:hypothetical protein [Bacteroides sp.]